MTQEEVIKDCIRPVEVFNATTNESIDKYESYAKARRILGMSILLGIIDGKLKSGAPKTTYATKLKERVYVKSVKL